jgi:hypothetical protein
MKDYSWLLYHPRHAFSITSQGYGRYAKKDDTNKQVDDDKILTKDSLKRQQIHKISKEQSVAKWLCFSLHDEYSQTRISFQTLTVRWRTVLSSFQKVLYRYVYQFTYISANTFHGEKPVSLESAEPACSAPRECKYHD